MNNPITHMLLIFGRLKPHGDELYAQYLRGTIPVMQRYGVEVLAVGSGVATPDLAIDQERWPVNAILGFKDYDAYLAFFEDDDYQRIKTLYRDQAYDVLNLCLMEVDDQSWASEFTLSTLCNARSLIGVSLYDDRDADLYNGASATLVSGQVRGQDTPHMTQSLTERFGQVSLLTAEHSPPSSTRSRTLYYFANRPPRVLT